MATAAKTVKPRTTRQPRKATTAGNIGQARRSTQTRKTTPARNTTQTRKATQPRTTTQARKTPQVRGRQGTTAVAARTGKREHGPRTATVRLPFVTAEFRAPDMHLPTPHLPSRDEMSEAIDMARANLPKPERLAFYTGLGALAVVGMIEWPVAAAIGAGALIAQRAARRNGWAGNGGRPARRRTATS